MADSRRKEGDVSVWGEREAELYKAAKHGPDGSQFLDEHLYPFFSDDFLTGKSVLDLGAGACPWSEEAIRAGASRVVALDINEAMLNRISEEFRDRVERVVGDVNALPVSMKQDGFDVLISINVGCNLTTLDQHFSEAYEAAKPGATFLVTAPISLEIPFSQDDLDIEAQIDDMWSTGEYSQKPKALLNQLSSVLRATFVLDSDGKPILVTKENLDELGIKSGTPVIRKIPGLAVDNNFHTQDEYIQAALSAGWEIQNTHSDSFENSATLDAYNQSVSESEKLGEAYVGNPPFLVIELVKK